MKRIPKVNGVVVVVDAVFYEICVKKTKPVANGSCHYKEILEFRALVWPI